MRPLGNQQNNSTPRTWFGPLAYAGTVGMMFVVLVGCYNPSKNLRPANEGMIAPAGETTRSGGEAEAVDPAILREIITETGSTIQVGDEISVNVYQDEKLAGTYRIDNDGGFQWHYVGRVKTTGLTTNDLRRKLSDVAAKYLIEPSVIVNYVAQQPRSIRVLGETRTQGHFALKRKMRLIDAIAAAGGITANANQQEIILIRSVSPTEIRAGIFNYREAMLNPLNGAWASNVELLAGDTIFVPKSGKAQWESAINFINRLADTAVGIERSVVLYPDVESVISTGDTAGRNTIVVR